MANPLIKPVAMLLRQVAPLCFLASLAACDLPPLVFGNPVTPTGPTSVAPPPHPIAFDGDEIFFGDVVVGQSRVITLTLRNTGNAALTLGPPQASVNFAGLLSMSPLPIRLEVGEAVPLLLRFTPTAIGNVSGIFGIAAENVPGRNSIPINGTGVAPR